MSKNQSHPSDILVTIGDWIRYATSRFNQAGLCFGHGYTSAWDEAVHLVLHSLHLPHEVDPQVFHCHILQEERFPILELIECRVQARLPLAYILGEAWFCGLPFHVNKHVLIPRSPLGELIEKQFLPWIIEPDSITRILDIGTGSGCLAIAAAMAFPQALVDAVDVSAEALQVAAKNVARHQLQAQVNLLQSDCFTNLPGQKYELIISNPPYVSAEEMATLPAEYNHEPYHALYADQQGLAIVKNILKQAAQHLTPEGILVIEVGATQAVMAEHFSHWPLTWLDMARGGEGIFLITAQQLQNMTIEDFIAS